MPCTFVILFSPSKTTRTHNEHWQKLTFFAKHFNYISMATLPKNLEDEL
jgi:hypothetical protein